MSDFQKSRPRFIWRGDDYMSQPLRKSIVNERLNIAVIDINYSTEIDISS